LDFEYDDLIPYRVGAIAIRNGEEFAQPVTGILGLRFERLRLVSPHFNELCFDCLFCSGLFFVHKDIIPRTLPTGQTETIPPVALRPKADSAVLLDRLICVNQ